MCPASSQGGSHQGWCWVEFWSSSRNPPRSVSKQNKEKTTEAWDQRTFLVLFLTCTYIGYFPFSSSWSHQHSGLSAAITVTVHIWMRVSFAQHPGGGFYSTTYEKGKLRHRESMGGVYFFFFPNLQELVHLRLFIVILLFHLKPIKT